MNFVPGTDRKKKRFTELAMTNKELLRFANANENKEKTAISGKRRCNYIQPTGKLCFFCFFIYFPSECATYPNNEMSMNHCQLCLANKNLKD